MKCYFLVLCTLFLFNPLYALRKNITYGVSNSAFQVCGGNVLNTSNWAYFETQPRAIKSGEKSEYGCHHWSNYPQEISLMESMNINGLRCSIDWSACEKEKGVYDESVFAYYRTYFETLIAHNIKPMVTLHHFVHPQWFEKMGAFEKEENIVYFVQFCEKVFAHFGDIVDLWCTINEPTIYVLQGYIRGVFPPAQCNPLLGLQVLKNLMIAHTKVYESLKTMTPESRIHDIKIGFAHQYLKFYHYHTYNPLERIPGYLFNYVLNDTILEFCTTGVFDVRMHLPSWFTAILPPCITKNLPSLLYYQTPTQKRMVDFFGLNYYSRAVIKHTPSLSNPFDVQAACMDGEIMTDMPYAIYAQGLYDAIVEASKTGLPIYITENGIADAEDTKREFFLKLYLDALKRAIDDNYNVCGYYYWTLVDNFEWDEGYKMKFGLFGFDPHTKTYTKKPGTDYYAQWIKKYTQ